MAVRVSDDTEPMASRSAASSERWSSSRAWSPARQATSSAGRRVKVPGELVDVASAGGRHGKGAVGPAPLVAGGAAVDRRPHQGMPEDDIGLKADEPLGFRRAGRVGIGAHRGGGVGDVADVAGRFGRREQQPRLRRSREGPYQWQDWSFEWQATEAGRHTLRARATDAGNAQPEIPPWNRLGYGNNAIEVTYVDVR